jgi:hypothetical protein
MHNIMDKALQILFPIQLVLFGAFLFFVGKFIYITIKTKLS